MAHDGDFLNKKNIVNKLVKTGLFYDFLSCKQLGTGFVTIFSLVNKLDHDDDFL